MKNSGMVALRLLLVSSAIASAAPHAHARPPAPAYDLAADRAARLATARRELGDKIPTSVEGDVFVMAGPGVTGTAPFVRRALAAWFHDRFVTRPSRAISVYVFASEGPYDAYCKKNLGEACISPYGFYLPDRRTIVMNAGPGIGTLTHEMVHPILEDDFPSAPTWLNEGIASLYEAPVMPKEGEIHGARNWRLPRLRSGLASPKEKDEARLDALFGMSDERFRDARESLHYATARYLCQWLDSRGMLWPFYRTWRGDGSDKTGEKSFRAVVGKSPRDARDEWTAWVNRL